MYVESVAYAGDITLVSPTVVGMQEMLDILTLMLMIRACLSHP